MVEHTFEGATAVEEPQSAPDAAQHIGQDDLPDVRWPVELLAYAAGVIDSDGSIGIRLDTYAMRVRRLEAGPVYKERVTLRQIEPQAVKLLHDAFGGSRFITAPRYERSQPLHSWQVVDRMASTFLAAIAPYLRIKRRQAQLCVELRRLKDESRKARFAYGRGHRGGGRRPDSLAVAMGNLRSEILRLNQVQGRNGVALVTRPGAESLLTPSNARLPSVLRSFAALPSRQ